MNRILLLPLVAALGLVLGACQKQTSEAERKAEIERQVQQRVEAERQADEQQKLAQRQTELDAREAALAAKENRPVATATPATPARPDATAARPAPVRDAGDTERGSYATFYRKLDPYGDWMETSDYGYVFQPRPATQSRDWRPYTNGHWVYTDAGWTWISDEQFGWATYHYGRWVRLRSVGWVWVPGEQWAPAWVSWRKGTDYVGWAPLPPEAQFDRQTGIRNWADNYYDIGPEQYAFVPANQFGAKVSTRVVVPTERNVTIINQTTNVTNITYNNSVIVDRGPSYDDLRAGSSQPIERFRLERTPDASNERPVFRGEVVSLPTIDFRPAEQAARPARISRTIAQPFVERGWSGIRDAQAAQNARNKMQAEATPPPNAPPKRFVRPDQRPLISPPPAVTKISPPVPKATPALTPVPRPPATPGATPSAPVRPNRPDVKPRPPRPTPPAATTTPNDAPVATVRPPHPGIKPRPTMTVPPQATSAPDETPAAPTTPTRPAPNRLPAVTPAPSLEPTPPVPAENVFSPKAADRNRREKAAAAQEAMRKQRQQAQAQRRAEREQQMAERRARKTEPSPASPATAPAQPSPSAAPSSAAETPAASASEATMSDKEKAARQRRERRAERKNRRGGPNPAESPEPDASASPTAREP